MSVCWGQASFPWGTTPQTELVLRQKPPHLGFPTVQIPGSPSAEFSSGGRVWCNVIEAQHHHELLFHHSLSLNYLNVHGLSGCGIVFLLFSLMKEIKHVK